MPSVTAASIQEQLAEYRRRRQEEEAKLSRRTLPPGDTDSSAAVPSTAATDSTAADTASTRPQPAVVRGLLSSLQGVTSAVTRRLYAAVTPDHLLLAERRGRRGGGYVLGEHQAGEAGVVRRRNFAVMNAIAEDPLVEGAVAQRDAAAPLLGPADRGSHDSEDSDEEELFEAMQKSRTKRYLLLLCLKIVLWLLVWKVFIIWEFGAVYFLVSGFVLIGYNLRSGSRSPHEVSAYSVFNRDLRRIDGTVTPEQLQREMLFRM